MDEILRVPQGGRKPLPRPEQPRRTNRPGYWGQTVETAAILAGRHASRVVHRTEDVLSKVKLSRAGFLVTAALIGLFFVLTTIYSPSYVVSLDGADLGIVHEKADFTGAVDRVEEMAAGILGHDYTMDLNVEYTFRLSQKDEFTPAAAVETVLLDQIGEVMKSYVLSVNGAVIGSVADRAVLDGVLEEIAAPYLTENTTSYSFVEPVEIVWEYTAAETARTEEELYAALTANTSGETTYIVEKGDTFMAIAYAHNMSMSELEALNPDVTPERIQIGQELAIRKEIPLLSVLTTENVTYTQEIPCPVEEVKDSSMYTGDRKVVTEGIPGEEEINADVTYVNGYEENREILSRVTLSEPTTQVVAVGTKERPRTMPTGSFRWPISGRITSSFGYRYIFGSTSYHSGIDIKASYGAAIVAADGGTVTFAGSKGSYGNLVIIDHGNGIQTYYGHNSSFAVSAGDKVYKGQTIAYAGSTGRSTGPHCHFEIRINGRSVNPLSYLP